MWRAGRVPRNQPDGLRRGGPELLVSVGRKREAGPQPSNDRYGHISECCELDVRWLLGLPGWARRSVLHGFSEPSYYAWKAKFGGMKVSDA